jgi:hypothetical protein
MQARWGKADILPAEQGSAVTATPSECSFGVNMLLRRGKSKGAPPGKWGASYAAVPRCTLQVDYHPKRNRDGSLVTASVTMMWPDKH